MTHSAKVPTEPLARVLAPYWKKIALISLSAGVLGAAGSFLIPKTYTARTAFLSPQPQQGLAGAALASLGALSGLAGAFAGIKTPGDQFLSLLQSVTISDRIIEKFKLMEVYDVEYRMDARKELATNVRFGLGKKDNIITIEVDDHDPARAAEMANTYLRELKELSEHLNLTEAQQRRAFFEGQFKKTQEQLQLAQRALQKTGYNPGAIKAEPKAAAEGYAKLLAQTAAAEVKLQALRRSLNDSSAEVQAQLGVLSGLRDQLSRQERPQATPADQDYISAYRDYKYQETLLEIFARQFELAKLDESREANIFQVIDVATPPDRKSKPKRSIIALGAMFAGFLLACLWFRREHLRSVQAPQP